MILPLLVATQAGKVWVEEFGPTADPKKYMLQWPDEALSPPKLSPRAFGDPPLKWEFEWLTAAYASENAAARRLRFRVYSQDRKDGPHDSARLAGKFLLRLYDRVRGTYELDHRPDLGFGSVDVYLCWTGKAGGEQGVQVDDQGAQPRKVSAIYVYDLGSFTDPVEMAREIAHEYGHAILPPVGGFVAPENWANGILGERLFLRWARGEEVADGERMSAGAAALDAWVKKVVDPLEAKARRLGPLDPDLVRRDARGMDAYTGLVLWSERFLSGRAFGKALKVAAAGKASGVPAAIATIAATQPRLDVPATEPVWLPFPDGAKTGKGAPLARSRGWAKVAPVDGIATVINPEPR